MADLYQNKYRISPARHPAWDYGENAPYFVTICTKNRVHWFGQVKTGVMQLSPMGEIARRCWLEIPQHFPFIKLGNHIVMPNHVHGIVIIDKPGGGDGGGGSRDAKYCVSTAAVVPPPSHNPKNQFGPQSKNLASVVRRFKIGVTKNARLINPAFAWQPRYHDHIIRNKKSFHIISKYIVNNPLKWKEDKFYKI